MSKQRKRTQTALLVGLLLFTGMLVARPSQAKDAAQSATVTRSDLILAMNTLRVSNGLPALIEDPIINAVAQNTAEIMAANNMSWHIGDVRGRIAAAGYGGGATVWATENFAVGWMSIDEIMLVWSDYDHMRPATNPAYCHVGAGVAQTAEGKNYYVLQAAYISGQACGPYESAEGVVTGSGTTAPPPVSQIIIPVKVATPDADGRIYHIVRSGQSFWSVAIAYQITIRDLEIWNNLSRDDGLFVGQKLFIPSANTEGYATPTPVGMVTVATPDTEGKIIHEVQPYQTLIRISQAYNVKVDTILALNGWQLNWPLQIGQKLLIDPGWVTPSATPRPLTALEKLTPASDGNYYHTVASGEYLAWIAQLYEIKLADLLAWNGLSSDAIIRPGQQLLLRVTPPASDTPTAPPPTITGTPMPTPAALTPTHKASATLPGITQSASAQSEPELTGPPVPLVVLLVVTGLLALGWALRRR
jgi:LysM repeat protein